jgi:hypothetical protein
VDVDIDRAGEEEGVAVVQGARAGAPGWVNVLDATVGDGQAGADGRSVGSEDLPADLLDS